MILKQYYLGCLAHASYLVADEEAGVAAVVDPQRDVDEYIADAHRRGCRIEHVLLTHLHADFLAGHLELRDRVGARIYLGARAEAEYEFTPLADGDSRRARPGAARGARDARPLARVDLDPRLRPGSRSEQPHAVLTGDTLFIGDVGRPDLRASLGWSAEELGWLLYDSIQTKLLPLPDETLVYPAHGAGSLCGKHLSTETVSTIGVQRRYNYALQPMSRDEFVRVVTADQPDSPAYFTYDAVLNAKERPTLDEALAEGLTAALARRGARARRPRARSCSTRARAPTSPARISRGSQHRPRRELRDLGRHAARPRAADRDRRRARPRAGGGDPARPDRLRQRRRLPRRRDARARRPARTWSSGSSGSPRDARRAARGAGAAARPRRARRGRARRGRRRRQRQHPAGPAAERLGELPRDRPIVVHCSSGYRSSIAASILQREGFEQVSDLVGGLSRPIRVPSARSA